MHVPMILMYYKLFGVPTACRIPASCVTYGRLLSDVEITVPSFWAEAYEQSTKGLSAFGKTMASYIP